MGKFAEVAETMRTSNRNSLVFFICFMFMSSWSIYQVHCQDDSNQIDVFDANEENQDVEIYDEEEVEIIAESEEPDFIEELEIIEDEIDYSEDEKEDIEDEIVYVEDA